MTDELERLAPRFEELLKQERRAPVATRPGAEERLLAVLRAAGPAGGGSDLGDAGSGPAPTPDASATVATTAAAGWPVAKSLVVAAVTGALGFVGGLAVSPQKEPPARVPAVSAPAVSQPQPAESPDASSRAPTLDEVPAESEHGARPQVAPSGGRRRSPSRRAVESGGTAPAPVEPTPVATPAADAAAAPLETTGAAPDVQQASERQLIDAARVALGRGRAHDALVFLMGHQRRFPEGSFLEERELLAIEALVAQGRTRPARERARAFLTRFPKSAHAPRVRALIGTP